MWADNAIPTYFRALHLQQSPSTPYTISEFQGGSFDPWGGSSFAKCAELLNEEFERVFYKNDYSAGVTILSLYMVSSKPPGANGVTTVVAIEPRKLVNIPLGLLQNTRRLLS